MFWPFSKREAPKSRKPSAELKASMQQKLTAYQPSAKRAEFIGPATLRHPQGWFEYEKVAIDPDSSGFHAIPFTC